MWYFAAGDAGFYFAEQLKKLSWLPVVWRSDLGFGVSYIDRLWFQHPYEVFVKVLSTIGLSWWFIDKLLWATVLILGIFSAYKLASYILGKGKPGILASVVYITNTYILLLFGGGQIGVSLAYAFAPFVVYRIMKYSKSTLKDQMINGLWLSLLVAMDLRIAFLVALATPFWWYRSLISLAVGASVHLFWILPILFSGGGVPHMAEQYTHPGMLTFLSVADFSHALSLLHPNWPENLFGKVYFLQPEFLVLPLLAFSSLAWAGQKAISNKQPNRLLFTVYCPFFAFLSLLGAFFAKGVNPPAGVLFEWMFVHVPGFVMFRDPTKFYLYTAIGYSILIPFTLQKIHKNVVYVFFVAFWIFTLRGFSIPALYVPEEYVQLKDMLAKDTAASRTLWIPQKENFAYFSDVHPVLTASAGAAIDGSVKYVIVPVDVNQKIFLNDYKYDPSIREKLLKKLSEKRLLRDDHFRDLAVYVNPEFTGMKSSVPAVVGGQQQLANIGFGISVGFLCIWLIWIFLL